jgi:hypothetical protein
MWVSVVGLYERGGGIEMVRMFSDVRLFAGGRFRHICATKKRALPLVPLPTVSVGYSQMPSLTE